MSWHADEALLSRYANGEIDQSTCMALEAHLDVCAVCRAGLARVVDAGRVERGWEAVLLAISAPRRGPLERSLVKAGMSDANARLVAATPSLSVSWLVAVAVALGFAVIAAYQGVYGLLLFLVVAPLVPVLGVAAAYGPGVDPTYEIGMAAPLSSLRLLLVRAGAVLIATTMLAGVAGLMLPRLEWTAVAWLLPSLGLTLGSLALSTVVAPLSAARVVCLGWLVTVFAVSVPADDKLLLFSGWGQVVFVLLGAVAGMVLAWRRAAIEQRVAE